MKVAVIHPLRHHVYHSIQGVVRSGNEVVAFLGYYNKGDFIDKILQKTPFKKLADGWKYDKITPYVKTSTRIKILFLLYKKFPNKFEKKYFDAYQKWVIKNLKGFDCIHVLQDYCNDVIRYAHKEGMKIVYEQLQPVDITQIECLKKEIIKADYHLDYITDRFPQKKIDLQIENLNFADVVIAASKVTEESLMPYVDKNVFTFPYGAAVGTWPEVEYSKVINRKLNSLKIKVLYVGSINLIKGVQYIVETVRLLQEGNFEFTFVGKPLFEEDKRLIQEITEMPNCTYIESVPHIEINEIYRSHDVFMFQGLCEGFGMVTLEAMSNGLPCIVSDGGRGVIVDGEDGFINKNCDVSTIKNKLERLYHDRALLVKMSNAARHNALKFTWDAFSDNIKNIYTGYLEKL